MGAIRYSCPIRLVPTYILPEKKKTFQESPIPLKQTDKTDMARTTRLVILIKNIPDMARSTRLVMLIKNIYSL